MPEVLDFLTIDRPAAGYDADRWGRALVMAPNPYREFRYEEAVLPETPSFADDLVKVSFGELSAEVSWWNVKPFQKLLPYTMLYDVFKSTPVDAMALITSFAPEFVNSINSRGEITVEMLSSALIANSGVPPATVEKMLNAHVVSGPFLTKRQDALTHIYGRLLDHMPPQDLLTYFYSIKSEYWEEFETSMPGGDTEDLKTQLLELRKKSKIVHPSDLMIWIGFWNETRKICMGSTPQASKSFTAKRWLMFSSCRRSDSSTCSTAAGKQQVLFCRLFYSTHRCYRTATIGGGRVSLPVIPCLITDFRHMVSRIVNTRWWKTKKTNMGEYLSNTQTQVPLSPPIC
jgi:hypothetical protein